MSSVNRITKGFKFEDGNILFISLPWDIFTGFLAYFRGTSVWDRLNCFPHSICSAYVVGLSFYLFYIIYWECRRVNRHVITNFIQLVSLQPVDWFSQTKLGWKAPNEGYLHICGIYKSNNKQPRYQVISNYKSFVC